METAIKVPELVLLSRRNIRQKDLLKFTPWLRGRGWAGSSGTTPAARKRLGPGRGPVDLRQESASQAVVAIPETEIEGVFLVARGLVQLVDVGKRATSRKEPWF